MWNITWPVIKTLPAFCVQDALVREVQVQNLRKQELSLTVEGDFYSEADMVDELKLSKSL